jgi:hypothetical protein
LARKPKPVSKLCERCEAFFPSIASETCPQCFAPLTVLTDDEAITAVEYQLERMHDPDYVVRKTEEDEKFKEQSFGACLATLGLIVAVAFFSVILISAAQHRQVKHFRPTQSPLTANNSNVDADGLLPGRVGNLTRGTVAAIKQSGAIDPILHATYSDQIQIYVLPITDMNAQSLNNFHLIVSAISGQTNPPFISQEIHGKLAYYDIIGANGGLVGDTTQRLVSVVAR